MGMNPSLSVNHWGSEVEKMDGLLTLIEVRDGRIALHLVLLFSILVVCVISLDMVPRVELKDVVLLLQIARSELKRVAALLVELGIVGPVGRGLLSVGGSLLFLLLVLLRLLLLLLGYFELGDLGSELLIGLLLFIDDNLCLARGDRSDDTIRCHGEDNVGGS